MTTTQEPLFGSTRAMSEKRVEVLANILAGFRWPERAGKLKKHQEKACLDAARTALTTLAVTED
jgi:hypothetical protein